MISDSVECLKKKGYVVMNNYYTDEEIDLFDKEFDLIFSKIKSEVLNKEECSKDERIFNAQKYSSFISKRFYNNPFFNKICEEYTGKKPTKKRTLINKLFYEEGKIKNSGAGWHRDNHDCQFKVIMYLTDVNEKNGNFQFITKSSKKYIGFPKPRTRSYNTRYHDSTVSKILKEKDCELINITGKKGTIILADTTYIHRGNIIKEGKRRAITQYFY